MANEIESNRSGAARKWMWLVIRRPAWMLTRNRLARESDPNNPRQHLDLTAQIKKLTLPSEMGELFKAIAFTRGLDIPLEGFQLQDRRARL